MFFLGHYLPQKKTYADHKSQPRHMLSVNLWALPFTDIEGELLVVNDT